MSCFGCFNCFVSAFRYYHFDNFTFSHSHDNVANGRPLYASNSNSRSLSFTHNTDRLVKPRQYPSRSTVMTYETYQQRPPSLTPSSFAIPFASPSGSDVPRVVAAVTAADVLVREKPPQKRVSFAPITVFAPVVAMQAGHSSNDALNSASAASAGGSQVSRRIC